MKASREMALGIAILVLLVLITVAASLIQGVNNQPPLASTSSDRDGALALKLWIDQVGNPVDETRFNTYELPENAGLVFILQPDLVTASEVNAISKWVSAGGTLIAASDSIGLDILFRHYGFSLVPDYDPPQALSPVGPLLRSPAMEIPAAVKAGLTFESDKQDFLSLLAEYGKPVIVMFDSGAGRVILSSTVYPFTNQGLKDAGNPQLVLNLIAAARSNAPAWFDEWHHGVRSGVQIVGPDRWLRYTPAGNALLFIVAVVFLAFLLQGRSFGRPIPLRRDLRRRGPLEHLTAVANLNRRAGHHSAILKQYRQQVKRHLGLRYRLDPGLPDADFVDVLSRYNPTIDSESLQSLLKRLSRPVEREADLVKLAAEAAQWLDE